MCPFRGQSKGGYGLTVPGLYDKLGTWAASRWPVSLCEVHTKDDSDEATAWILSST